MKRAPIIGAGLAFGALVALMLLPKSVDPLPTPSTVDPRLPSPSISGSGDVGDPVQTDEDLPVSTVTTAMDVPVPSTTLPDSPALYDPRKTGEDLPPGYRLTLRRDEIKPIYSPVFIDTGKVDWPLDTLVIGVAGQTEAKAYPVTHLTSREMVNDTLDGTPILVSW
jgi:hypothetical protein